MWVVILVVAFTAAPVALAAATGDCGAAAMIATSERAPCHNGQSAVPAPCMTGHGCLMIHGALAVADAGASFVAAFDRSIDYGIKENRHLVEIIAAPPFEPPRRRS